jgi:heat shock protein 90kDa beta
MMEIALGGRWGRAEEDASEAEAEADEEVLSDSTSGEVAEAEVVEPSEVRAESDPWKD